jgi:AraC-like DNA-binding protein
LHPDETHDGAAGTDDGFGYRILYVAPALVRDALDDGDLPFVADPVQQPSASTRLVAPVLADIDEPIDELAHSAIVAAVADVLRSLGSPRETSGGAIDVTAVERVREYLAAHAAEQIPAATLERIAGTDRFTIARHFRRAFGTSPDRYRTLRRLGLARKAIENGEPLTRAAADAGFADQSHMTRQFKRAYGLTPARWTSVVGAE